MKRLNILTTIALVFLAHAAQAETVTFTLDQAIERAMQANYDVVEAEGRLNQVKAIVGRERAGALPQINAAALYKKSLKLPEYYFNNSAVEVGSRNEYSASLELTQTIYDGRVFKAIKAAKSEKRKSEADLKNVKTEIKLLVKKLFYQILLADKTIEITKKTLSQLESHLTSIRKRYNEGLESDYTLMRQEVEVSNIKPELSGAEQAKLVLTNSLKTILAMPEDSELLLEGKLSFNPGELPAEGMLVSEAITKRDDLIAASARKESLKQKVGVERAWYLPSLSFQSNLTWDAQSNDYRIGQNENYYAFNVGAFLSWPVFDGLRTHYRIKEAKSELKIANEEEAKLHSNVVSDVKNARAALKEAHQREASQKKTLSLAEKAAAIASVRFKVGLLSQLELNDTILSRDRAERLYSEAVYDCLVAEAELERALGGRI